MRENNQKLKPSHIQDALAPQHPNRPRTFVLFFTFLYLSCYFLLFFYLEKFTGQVGDVRFLTNPNKISNYEILGFSLPIVLYLILILIYFAVQKLRIIQLVYGWTVCLMLLIIITCCWFRSFGT